MKKILTVFIIFIALSTFADISISDSTSSNFVDKKVYNGKVYVAYSKDGYVYFSSGSITGSSFSQSVKLNSSYMAGVGKPSIGVNSNYVYIFWTGSSGGETSKIYYSVSINDGLSFTVPLRLMPSGGDDNIFTQVQCAVTTSHVGYSSIVSSGVNDIRVYFGYDSHGSLDGDDLYNITSSATVFKTDLLNSISGLNLKAGSNGDFNVLFERDYSDYIEIFYKNYSSSSIPGDITVVSGTSQNNSGISGFKAMPSMIMDGTDVVFVYQDNSSGVNRLKVLKSVDNGNNWDSIYIKNMSYGINVTYPSLVNSGGEIHCIWDEGNVDIDTKYKKVDFLNSATSEYSVSFDGVNKPETLAKASFASDQDKIYYVYSSISGDKKVYYGTQYLDSSTSGSTVVSSKYPEAGDSNVSVGDGIRIEFSDAVSDVLTTNVSLTATNASSVSFNVSMLSSNVAIINPTQNLSYNTSYTVILSGVKDLSGNSIPPVEWSFKTASQDITSAGSITKAITYPNPFRGGVFKFSYDFSRQADSVKIKIYNMKGRLIKSLRANDPTGAGSELIWDLYDKWGNSLSNGVYFYKIVAVFGGVSSERSGKFIIAK